MQEPGLGSRLPHLQAQSMDSQHAAHSLQSQMRLQPALQPQAPGALQMHSQFSLQSHPSTQAQQAGRPAMAISNPFSDLAQTSMGQVLPISAPLRKILCLPPGLVSSLVVAVNALLTVLGVHSPCKALHHVHVSASSHS